MYSYMTLADDTEIVHSHLKHENGVKTISVNFERPKLNGFDSARISLPTYKWLTRDGFTDDEIKSFEQFAERHAHHLYYYAETRRPQ